MGREGKGREIHPPSSSYASPRSISHSTLARAWKGDLLCGRHLHHLGACFRFADIFEASYKFGKGEGHQKLTAAQIPTANSLGGHSCGICG